MAALTGDDHLINFSLLGLTKQAAHQAGFGKQAFVPGGDPSMGGGGGGAPPGGDPAAGGGAPPPDPSAGGGGAPPAGGGGGGPDISQMIQQAVQQAMAGAGGAGGAGAGSGAGGLKPKIDVNVEIMQIKNMLAKICDTLGVQMPAQDMVATPDKLNAMAQGQSTSTPAAGGGGGAAGGGGAIGAMPPMDPMQGSGAPGGGEKAGSYKGNGSAFDTSGFSDVTNKAQAVIRLRKARPQ